MATKTEIANLAMAHIGHGKPMSDVDTDTTAEAKAVRAVYEICRKKVLEDLAWPFAKKRAELSLITADPSDGWGYSYTYPSDCAKILRIVPEGNDTDLQLEDEIELIVMHGTSSREIWTDQSDAVLEYIKDVTETGRFSGNFTMAFSYLLAANISPRVAGGDNPSLKAENLNMYYRALSEAGAHALNEERRGIGPLPSLVRARRV